MKSKIQQVTGMRIGELLVEAILNNNKYLSYEDVGVSLNYYEDENLIRIVKDYLSQEEEEE